MEQQNQYQDENKCYSCVFSNTFYPCKTPFHLKNYARLAFLIFLLLAILTFVVNQSVQSTQVTYATSDKCKTTQIHSQRCSIDFQISTNMEGPVYVLYFIQDIYINHKKYIHSYSTEQLSGKAIDVSTAEKQCQPIVFNRHLPFKKSWGGIKLDPDAVASPCGLKPLLYFNDTYRIYDENSKQIPINEEDIARSNDGRIKRQPQSSSKQWIDPQNQHFISYLRTSSLMTKKRLWGRIEEGMKPGNYTLLIENKYKVKDLNIIKGIELTTTTIFGGKNFFFPITFLICGLVCLGFSIYAGINLDQYEVLIRRHLKLQ